MIIQIRGTSGSGKTTVMRKLMEGREWQPHFIGGRKRPLYYTSEHLIVLGHYEIDCGGCDTIGSAPKVFDTIHSLIEQEVYRKGDTVLSEGLLWGEDVKWTLALEEMEETVKAFFLATDPEECLLRVIKRQAGRKPVDPERVRRKLMTRVGTIDRARKRLVTAGVSCKRVSCGQAVRQIKKLMGV